MSCHSNSSYFKDKSLKTYLRVEINCSKTHDVEFSRKYMVFQSTSVLPFLIVEGMLRLIGCFKISDKLRAMRLLHQPVIFINKNIADTN